MRRIVLLTLMVPGMLGCDTRSDHPASPPAIQPESSGDVASSGKLPPWSQWAPDEIPEDAGVFSLEEIAWLLPAELPENATILRAYSTHNRETNTILFRTSPTEAERFIHAASKDWQMPVEIDDNVMKFSEADGGNFAPKALSVFKKEEGIGIKSVTVDIETGRVYFDKTKIDP